MQTVKASLNCIRCEKKKVDDEEKEAQGVKRALSRPTQKGKKSTEWIFSKLSQTFFEIIVKPILFII